MEANASDPLIPQRPSAYPGSMVATAAVATFFFPVLSLIAALFLYRNERDPAKRSALRTWAVASGAWLAVQALVALLVFLAVAGGEPSGVDRSGPCVGGPQLGQPGRDVSGNGTRFEFPCAISGTATVSFPNGHD